MIRFRKIVIFISLCRGLANFSGSDIIHKILPIEAHATHVEAPNLPASWISQQINQRPFYLLFNFKPGSSYTAARSKRTFCPLCKIIVTFQFSYPTVTKLRLCTIGDYEIILECAPRLSNGLSNDTNDSFHVVEFNTDRYPETFYLSFIWQRKHPRRKHILELQIRSLTVEKEFGADDQTISGLYPQCLIKSYSGHNIASLDMYFKAKKAIYRQELDARAPRRTVNIRRVIPCNFTVSFCLYSNDLTKQVAFRLVSQPGNEVANFLQASLRPTRKAARVYSSVFESSSNFSLSFKISFQPNDVFVRIRFRIWHHTVPIETTKVITALECPPTAWDATFVKNGWRDCVVPIPDKAFRFCFDVNSDMTSDVKIANLNVI